MGIVGRMGGMEEAVLLGLDFAFGFYAEAFVQAVLFGGVEEFGVGGAFGTVGARVGSFGVGARTGEW
jgi:hypothetical protein